MPVSWWSTSRDRSDPKLVVHKNWAPPFGGSTLAILPLPDRDLLIVLDEAVLDEKQDGFKPIWVFDNQVKSNPISVAAFPEPSRRDYIAVGGHFGPHNIHENRPGSLVSSELIFATYRTPGVRVYDIRDPLRPIWKSEHACPRRRKSSSTRARSTGGAALGGRVRRCEQALLSCTDWSGAGLYIMEYTG